MSETGDDSAETPESNVGSSAFATSHQPLATVLCLTGPTAGGKTSTGIELAKLLGAEIVSLDSMALYRGMDIGTAKPSAAERAAVPHHLIDVIEPHEEFSVAQYVAAVREVDAEIRSRGRQTLLVGGTPLYLKALLRGLFEGPPADWELRHRWEALAKQEGDDALHARLALVDPAAAAKLHPNDMRRIIRALEVFEKLGQPISQLQQTFDHPRSAAECRVIVLDWHREELYSRIDARVNAMFAAGLVGEVQSLIQCDRPLSRTAGQAVGYREVLEHLRGQRDLAATIELVKLRTRQFAKRQHTWFRGLPECQWLPVAEPFSAEAVAKRVLPLIQ